MTDTTIRAQALACRDAAQAVAALSTEAKNALLRAMADALDADAASILAANAEDLRAAAEKGIAGAMLDRLTLDPPRLAGIANALREVAALPDPVGVVTRRETRPNGISVERVRMPLGVVAMIYEARPNVTADAAALCLKAGNGVILRGGSEAIRSNVAIAGALKRTLSAHGVPAAAITLIEDLRRETMVELLQLNDIVDLAIPRGGEGLIRFVAEHARVPVIKHYKGVCHLYVDAAADLDLALDLLLDGKVSRPGDAAGARRHRRRLPAARRGDAVHARRRVARLSACARTHAWRGACGRRRLGRGIPRPDPRRARGRVAGRGHRPHPPPRLRPHRGHRHPRRRRRRAFRARPAQRGGDGQRLLALLRRRRTRPRRRDRHLHHPPARLRPDGRGVAYDRALRGAGGGADAESAELKHAA
jgi:hypothetical protein